MIIDTHAHLYLDQFDEDRDAVLRRAWGAEVDIVVMPAIDVPSIQQAVDLCEEYDGLYAMAALHPSETQEATEEDFEAVVNWCSHPSVVAVGESGLDYYWDRSFDDRQKRFFRKHIRLAIEADLPLVIHNRDAAEDILAVLEEEYVRAEVPEKMRGILHCYVDPPRIAERAWNLGFYVGVGGIMTFSNSDVDQYVEEVPLEHIVVETDSPYLAPEPNRGDRNEPAYVRHVAERLAEIKDLPLETVAEVTTQNARAIYELDDAG
ncbi:TatD DNase family protein [Salinibacter ruber]|uniref:TatD family hydrolase n=1 Tax=Salinibacter ruber TaxID=146919 RepID=UPI002073D64D|nr:TatD family hydrolase [Salinibacter ruber]MCS3629462.1 TatD DNase family protein [Salinibacter ruber]MCS3644035.1 TatD DNase family protein [Salinibacter ruber]MCS3938474.1 TatD DNase family protein [Salinibacter ruber]MCS4051162.1 TatD DNase family protein [Salinibacter ruber]MCS4099033.1 TatD DNase family protein [Salinibacter ruber]